MVLTGGTLCPRRGLTLPRVKALGSRSLRSVAIGVVALALAYVLGVVLPGLRNPLSLAGVFVLVVTAAMLGFGRTAQWVQQLPPLLTLVVVAGVVVVVLLVLLWLISPSPMGPGPR
jgi:hypothetical protein